MMGIDYGRYLSGLGEVETDHKAVIKRYLEEQAEKDPALKSLYRPERLDDCYGFITECARRSGRGCVYLEDAVVFKMARDYFLEVLPEADAEPQENVAGTGSCETAETEAETDCQAADNLEPPAESGEPENGDAETGDSETAETGAETDCRAADNLEPPAKSGKPENGDAVFDSDGNGLLFGL